MRLSGEGFTGTCDELIVSPSVKNFINRGYLSAYKYYSVARNSFIQRSINDIKKFNQGDYAESEMERVCDNDRIRAEVVKTYLEYAKGKKGIVYTINKRHNKHLCDKFIENGVKAVAIDSDTPAAMRQEYIASFRSGDIDIICNVNLFTEGFDCPDIEFIQLARPTKSLALYLQQVGRGLRISEDKEETLFLDNVGLYNRFGFPSSRRHWRHHFEGRYVGNKTEEEVENEEKEKKQNPSVEGEKQRRRQSLEEGHEEVYLIDTEDGDDIRVSQFVQWLAGFQRANVRAYDKAFLELNDDSFVLRHRIFGHWEICSSKPYSCPDEVQDIYLKDRNKKLHENVTRYLDSDLGYIIDELRDLHFSKEELNEIIQYLLKKDFKFDIVPQSAIEKSVDVGDVVILFYFKTLDDKYNRRRRVLSNFDSIAMQLLMERLEKEKE